MEAGLQEYLNTLRAQRQRGTLQEPLVSTPSQNKAAFTRTHSVSALGVSIALNWVPRVALLDGWRASDADLPDLTKRAMGLV